MVNDVSEGLRSEPTPPLSGSYTVVDLSQPIYPGMPVYDVFIPTQYFPVMTYEQVRQKSGGHWAATAFGLLMCDHSGTHVDSISHIDDSVDALAIDQFPPERFISDAICLDVSHVAVPDFISRQILEQALANAGLDLRQSDTVLLHTGHFKRHYPEIEYMGNHTGLDREAMEWLADHGVVNVGVDAPAIEHIDRMTTADCDMMPAHRVCRERGMNNTENLAHLDQVAGKRFIFIGLPLLLQQGSGSPIRAVALVPHDESLMSNRMTSGSRAMER